VTKQEEASSNVWNSVGTWEAGDVSHVVSSGNGLLVKFRKEERSTVDTKVGILDPR